MESISVIGLWPYSPCHQILGPSHVIDIPAAWWCASACLSNLFNQHGGIKSMQFRIWHCKLSFTIISTSRQLWRNLLMFCLLEINFRIVWTDYVLNQGCMNLALGIMDLLTSTSRRRQKVQQQRPEGSRQTGPGRLYTRRSRSRTWKCTSIFIWFLSFTNFQLFIN